MRADELWPLGQCPPCIGAAMWGGAAAAGRRQQRCCPLPSFVCLSTATALISDIAALKDYPSRTSARRRPHSLAPHSHHVVPCTPLMLPPTLPCPAALQKLTTLQTFQIRISALTRRSSKAPSFLGRSTQMLFLLCASVLCSPTLGRKLHPSVPRSVMAPALDASLPLRTSGNIPSSTCWPQHPCTSAWLCL